MAFRASSSGSPYLVRRSAGSMVENLFPWRFLEGLSGVRHLSLLADLPERRFLPAQQPGNSCDVPVPLRRGARVVAADRRPRVAKVLNALGKHPGPDLDIHAWIGERFTGDTH